MDTIALSEMALCWIGGNHENPELPISRGIPNCRRMSLQDHSYWYFLIVMDMHVQAIEDESKAPGQKTPHRSFLALLRIPTAAITQ